VLQCGVIVFVRSQFSSELTFDSFTVLTAVCVAECVAVCVAICTMVCVAV